MANTVVHAANSEVAVVTGWTNPSNAFNTTTDGTFATATPGLNGTVSGDFFFSSFLTSEIPDGSQILSVTATVNWGMTRAVAGGTLGVQLYDSGTAIGTETTQTATTQQNASVTVTSGISLNDLRNGLVKARVRCTQGNSGQAMTGNLDFVALTVTFAPPKLGTIVKATGVALRSAARVARRKGGLAILAAVVLPTGHATFNNPLPFGVGSTVHVGTVPRNFAPVRVVKKKVPHVRRRGHAKQIKSVVLTGTHVTVNQRLPFGVTANVITSAVASKHGKPLVVKGRRLKPRTGGVASLSLFVPANTINATVNQPFPFAISSSVDVPGALAYWAGAYVVPKAPPKPRRGHVKTVKPVTGSTGYHATVNQKLPFSISSAVVLNIDATVNQRLPLTQTFTGSVNVDATVNQRLPFAPTFHGSVNVDATVNQRLPFSISAAVTAGSSFSATFNQPFPLAISAHTSVNVDGTTNQQFPLAILAKLSATTLASLDQPLPFAIQTQAVGPLSPVTPSPTTADVSSLPTSANITSLPSSANITSLQSSVNILSVPVTANITSSESTVVPNLTGYLAQGDTSPPLQATLGPYNATTDTVTPDNLTGCTVTINITQKQGKNTVPVQTDAACTVTDPVNGVVQYNWQSNDSAVPGVLTCEFKSVDGSGKIKRYPDTSAKINVQVAPQVGP